MTQAEQTKEQILKKIPQDEQKGYFKNWMVEPMSHLPSEYGSNCNTHLKSGSADTLDNEGDTILDQGQTTYPFRAFSYCLIKTLVDKYGDKAKTAVRDEKTRGGGKHWMNALNDRENDLRARHGSSPLALDRELVARAQRWADQNAANCRGDYHIPDTHEDYLLQGKATGESLSSGGGKNDQKVNAYRAVNGWYEEINSYPWSEGGLKDPRKQPELFDAVGHFTQTVWAASERVGYGYAYNPNCPNRQGPPGKYFITARYFPAGNYPNQFQDNVKPPKQ
jgi:hypothetical protein